MKPYEIIDKREGETPLQALERFRTERRIPAHVPMTYAGRLDPMASGVLPILMGDECKKKEAYLALDKVYEFEILFGIKTDTGDILGIVEQSFPQLEPVAADRIITPGTYRLPYPAYSSKTVGGVPLFVYARTGRLHDINVPVADMVVKSVEGIGMKTISGAVVRAEVLERLSSLDTDLRDFRLTAVRKSWEDVNDGAYALARYRAVVSSGTYIRSLAEEAGKRLLLPALAYNIRRPGVIGL